MSVGSALRWAGVAGSVALLGWLATRFDGAGLARALSGVGFRAVLLVLPFALAVTLDALAWRRLLSSSGHRVGACDLLLARVVAEALTLSLPAGAGVAESVVPALVRARTGVSSAAVLASSVARRWTVMRAHAAYVVVGAISGFGVLRAHSGTLVGSDALPWLVLASAVLPLGSSLALRGTFSGGALERAGRLLSRMPRARDFVGEAELALLGLARRRDPVPTLLLVGAWACETLEAFLLLHLLGADAALADVLALEAGLSVVRSAAFFAPAGLGVQDLGYARGFDAFGFGEATGAFLLLKRSRELAVATVGWTLLGLLRGRKGARAPVAAAGGAPAGEAVALREPSSRRLRASPTPSASRPDGGGAPPLANSL